MVKLKEDELLSINAGASIGWIIGGIIAGLSFLVGSLDGYFRPYHCR